MRPEAEEQFYKVGKSLILSRNVTYEELRIVVRHNHIYGLWLFPFHSHSSLCCY